METPSNQWCLTPKQEGTRVEHDFGTIHSEFLHPETRRGVTSVENDSSRLIAGA